MGVQNPFPKVEVKETYLVQLPDGTFHSVSGRPREHTWHDADQVRHRLKTQAEVLGIADRDFKIRKIVTTTSKVLAD